MAREQLLSGATEQVGDAQAINSEWYRALFDHSPNAVLLAETQTGAILAANTAACRMLGYTAEQLRTKERFQATGDPAVIWEAHRVGRDLEYCHIEKLANLDTLPRPYGFKVTCFPVKLAGGSAGWTRVVAIFEDL